LIHFYKFSDGQVQSLPNPLLHTPNQRQLAIASRTPPKTRHNSTPYPTLPQIQKPQKAHPNKTPQHNPVPAPLRPNPAHNPINPRHAPHHPLHPPPHPIQLLPLHPKVLVHGVSLAQHAVGHGVRVVEAGALVEHVVRFGFGRVGGVVGGDVGADRGEEVGAGAGEGDLRVQAGEVGVVVGEGGAVAGEVGGF